ncbi:MAG: hypothetical protein RSE41_07045 [Clostridia bacterium]
MSFVEKENTGKLIDKYLLNEFITHIFFIVDIRHNPTNDDKLMYDYLISYNIPFTILANKADKIVKSKIDEKLLNITKVLFAKEQIIPISTENKLNIDVLEKMIKESI